MKNSTLEKYLSKCTRQELIRWLNQNDSNGSYSDEQSIAEGLPLLTYEQALEIALRQAEDA